MDKKSDLGQVIRLAGAFVACVIGSGFATGQEIVQFFTGQGRGAVAGTVVTGIVFALCGALFMKHGNKYDLKDPVSIVSFYFGTKSGKAVELVFQFFLFGVYCIMIAGAGATLEEYFGLPAMAGRILLTILCIITVIMGLTKLTDVLGGIGPVIIVFALIVGICSIAAGKTTAAEGAMLAENLDIIKTSGGWLWSALLYPGFNAIVVLFLTCSIGQAAPSEKTAVKGGLLGGFLFFLAIFTMNMGLLLNIGDIYSKSVPTLFLAQNIGKVFAVVFSVIICCGIYTTAVPMLWGVVRHFAEDRTKKSVILTVAFAGLGLLLGMTDFRTLINIIYPFSGYFGILLMALAVFRELKNTGGNS